MPRPVMGTANDWQSPYLYWSGTSKIGLSRQRLKKKFTQNRKKFTQNRKSITQSTKVEYDNSFVSGDCWDFPYMLSHWIKKGYYGKGISLREKTTVGTVSAS